MRHTAEIPERQTLPDTPKVIIRWHLRALTFPCAVYYVPEDITETS